MFWGFLLWGDLGASAVSTLSVLSWITGIIAGVFMVLTGAYCGFAMSYCKGLQFWNTGLLPLVFVLMGFADGLALAMGVNLATGGADESSSARSRRGAASSSSPTPCSSPGTCSAPTGGIPPPRWRPTTSSRAARSWVFWILLVLLGIITPLVISFATLAMGSHTEGLLIVAIIGHTVGAFALKYSVLKVGIYRSVLPKVA